jgi:hypothetical protein
VTFLNTTVEAGLSSNARMFALLSTDGSSMRHT